MLSLGLRFSVPLVTVPAGSMIGAALAPCTTAFFCDSIAWGMYGGFLAGFGLTALIDAFALGWEREPNPRPSTEAWWTIVPTASARGGGLSLAGSF